MSQAISLETQDESNGGLTPTVAGAPDRQGSARHSVTWELPKSLKLQGLFSLGWSGLSQVVTMFVRLGSTIILARLLAPEAYGVFATALAVVITLEWFSDLGVVPALLCHPEGDNPVYLNTGWWINVCRGVTLTTICMVLAYPLTRYYYRLPNLFPVLLTLSTMSTIHAVRSPGMPLLRRELDYRSICILDLTQLLFSTGVSLFLAWQLRSVWAIVWGTVAGSAAATVVSYVLCPMRPGWSWDRRVATEVSRMSRQILANTLVAALWINADRLLGLRFASTADMGLYAVAWNLVSFMEGLAGRVCEIYFSMLSRIRDPEERRAWHQTVCHRVSLWGMPLLSVGAIGAPLVIRVLYDRRYTGAGVLLALLIARLMARLLEMVQYQHLVVKAEVYLATRAYLVAAVAQLALLMTLGRAFGVIGIAISGLLSTMVLTATQSILIRLRGEPSLRSTGITFVYVLATTWICYLLN